MYQAICENRSNEFHFILFYFFFLTKGTEYYVEKIDLCMVLDISDK